MITIKLRDAMERYLRRKQRRITYAELAELTGIAASTLRKIGASLTHHTTLARIEKLCRALEVTPGDLLEIIEDPPKPKPKRVAKEGGQTPPKPKRTAKKRKKTPPK